MATFTQSGGAGTLIIGTGAGVTFAGFIAAFPADGVNSGFNRFIHDVPIQIGDGVITTTMNEREPLHVILAAISGLALEIKANVTLNWGDDSGLFTSEGFMIMSRSTSSLDYFIITGGINSFYGGYFGHLTDNDVSSNSTMKWNGGTNKFLDCSFTGIRRTINNASGTIAKRCYWANINKGIEIFKDYAEFEDNVIANQSSVSQLISAVTGTKTLIRLKVINSFVADMKVAANTTLRVIETDLSGLDFLLNVTNSFVQQATRFNLRLVDKNSADLSGVNVKIVDSQAVTLFDDVTDSNGLIPEQTFDWRQRTGSPTVTTDKFPIAITLTLSGFVTKSYNLELEDLDVQQKIDHVRNLETLDDQADPTFNENNVAAIGNTDLTITTSWTAATPNSGVLTARLGYRLYIRINSKPTLTDDTFFICKVYTTSFIIREDATQTILLAGSTYFIVVEPEDDAGNRFATTSIQDNITAVPTGVGGALPGQLQNLQIDADIPGQLIGMLVT